MQVLFVDKGKKFCTLLHWFSFFLATDSTINDCCIEGAFLCAGIVRYSLSNLTTRMSLLSFRIIPETLRKIFSLFRSFQQT